MPVRKLAYGTWDAATMVRTIVVLFEILVEYRIFLDNMLRRRRANRSSVRIEQLALKVPFPKLRFGELGHK